MAVRVHYLAFDRTGKAVSGVMEAASEREAEEALWGSGLIVTRVKRIRPGLRLYELLPTVFGPGGSSAVSFARQLSTLLESGFPLLPALEILGGEHAHPAMRDTLRRIRQSLSEGHSFSDALAEYPNIFPAVFVRLALIGEQTGDLVPLLRRAADYLESGANVRQKVRASLTYPAIVALTAGGAVYVLLTFSIPMMAGLLEEFGTDLPILTRIIIIAGNAFSVWVTRVLALLILGGIVAFLARKTVRGRYVIDRYLILRPPFGGILRRSSMARVAQTMASLLEAGIPLHEALEMTIGATENAYLRSALEDVRRRLLEGIQFSDALQTQPVFPVLMTEMSRVGERTGNLASQLQTIHGIYQHEFEAAIARLVGLLEPALILIVGGLVGLIGATVISTVYSVLPSTRGAGL